MSEAVAHVLVVEDDPLARRILQQILVSGGYVVDSAAEGHEALQKVKRERPDVVVTDWTMPGMDGLTLCRLIKGAEEGRFIHVIMLSARGETEAKVTGLDTGADDYLVKPVAPVELLARVRAGLRLQRALSELSVKNELLERLALTDPLTGLANRRAFEESLATELSRSRRYTRPAALLFLDLDRFKLVNDTWGHFVGDEVLAGFADLLRARARRGDLAARVGGEEFAVLLPQTTKTHAVLAAERIRKATEDAPLGRSRPVSVTVSIGVASTDGGSGPDVAPFLQAADRALYRAKSAGRNRVAVEPDGRS